MEFVNNVLNILQFLGLAFVVVIFFIDPIRRWNFFGYRPTAIVGLFDSKTGKVLFSKVHGVWSFNQGGIYEENIYLTVNEILHRELGLATYRFRLIYTKALGSLLIKDRELLTRPRITSISIAPRLRGKGYMACYAQADLSKIESEIQKGTGIEDVKVVSVEEARNLLKEFQNDEHDNQKQRFILQMLEEIEKLMNLLKK
ncbi:MAG: hypothetical protein HUU50_06100 [Candidatus Brocadiae bacterium]|nr:hypothetical protein [Candidatus Brocadiia bacterium]